MTFSGQEYREKSGTTAYIKNAEIFSCRKLFPDLFHPTFSHGTVKFLSPLFKKTFTSFSPVINDTFFAFIVRTDDPSIGNHRAVSRNLQSTALIKNHTVKLCNTDLFYVPFIVSDFTQKITFFEYISRLFERIPETCFLRILIAYICYFERIISTEILLSEVHSKMAENISYISSCRTCFLISPCSHSASFNKNTWNSLRCSIVI